MVTLVTILLAGCGSPPPGSPSPPAPARPPLACVGVGRAQCEQALAIIAQRLAGTAPSWVQVAWSLCDGPCPGSERGVWRAHLTVEFADPRDPETIIIEVDGNAVNWERIETALVQVAPRSAALSAPVVPYTLGHCGLASGIDVDGALWDPVGMIDPSNFELINGTEATFSLISPQTATLRTAGGTVVELVRHAGVKHLPGCD
jgi:hypothetical protein